VPGFLLDTFVVVDMPPEVVRPVRAVRQRYGSARQFLPVEITVAGSSGCGVFAPDQDADRALDVLSEIATSTGAFLVELTPVERFPESGVFYFGIKDSTRLVNLHRRVTGSELRFKESPFPFSPHLTIDTFEAPGPELERDLFALVPPKGKHLIEAMSVYSLRGWDCRLVRTFPFGRSSS